MQIPVNLFPIFFFFFKLYILLKNKTNYPKRCKGATIKILYWCLIYIRYPPYFTTLYTTVAKQVHIKLYFNEHICCIFTSFILLEIVHYIQIFQYYSQLKYVHFLPYTCVYIFLYLQILYFNMHLLIHIHDYFITANGEVKNISRNFTPVSIQNNI